MAHCAALLGRRADLFGSHFHYFTWEVPSAWMPPGLLFAFLATANNPLDCIPQFGQLPSGRPLGGPWGHDPWPGFLAPDYRRAADLENRF